MKYQPKTKEELKALCDDLSVNLGDIDTSRITDMSDLFYCAKRKDFSGIETWDVSHVTDMSNIFWDAKFFNQPIGNWDVSNVESMRNMFSNAISFNQDISCWDVSHVTDMNGMFEGAKHFNKPIGDWNVSNVIDMSCMFYFADNFNQDISRWDVSHVENMIGMFHTAEKFNQPIEHWNISSVKDMDDMFGAAWSFKRILPKEWAEKAGYKNPKKYVPETKEELKALCDDLSVNLGDIDTSKIMDMSGLFLDSKREDFSGIEIWDVSHVEDMSFMFRGTKFFNQDISGWNVSNVVNMRSMFCGAISFNQDISKWDVSDVSNMMFMFAGAHSFNQKLPKDWADKGGYTNPVVEQALLKEKKVSLDEISVVLSEAVHDLTKRGAKIKDIDRVMKDMVRGVSR